MKKLIKISGFVLATVMIFFISLSSSFAAGDPAVNGSSLTGFQIFGGLVILLLVILVPLAKRSHKKEIN
jgi:hypothetical protein